MKNKSSKDKYFKVLHFKLQKETDASQVRTFIIIENYYHDDKCYSHLSFGAYWLKLCPFDENFWFNPFSYL